ncbi:reducing type I polyketide synthase [Paramyrothecium foliicola]|nr:reducing type I polyketide synthase [Paramyrothecium foliicola]
MVGQRVDVEIQTLDGITLRGWLYPSDSYGSAIVMTTGFNCVKEMTLPTLAEWFQDQGLTILLYDNRTIGASGGLPRNDIDPNKQVEDYHDAVSFLLNRCSQIVDPKRVILWGYSLSATVALVAAALDKRAAAVIAICPAVNVRMDKSSVTQLAMQDGADRLLKGQEPMRLPVLASNKLNTSVWGAALSDMDLSFVHDAMIAFPGFGDHTTVRSYYNLAKWCPLPLMPDVSPTPVLIVAADQDKVAPVEELRSFYNSFDGPKDFEVVLGKGHMNVLLGDGFEHLMQAHSVENLPSGGSSRTPLAIIGMSFRFPGEAVSTQGFWNMLMKKTCTAKKIPVERFHIDNHHNVGSGRLDTLSYNEASFLEEPVDLFDAHFFSTAALEAQAMDPIHRLLLETTFHAFENAGLSLDQIAGTKTAVFSGGCFSDYRTMLEKDPYPPPKYSVTGTSGNMQANRISWFFDLKGPSAAIDTACSSSLLALDLTCQSIWAGDATMGVVCGSNLFLTPDSGLILDNLNMLSKDGRCFSFDHRANGYGRGEGVATLIVKPVDAAIRDGDTIRAIIRATGSNQDGRTPGITMPSQEAQTRLITDTYAKAGLELSATAYVEAHGTGTPVGDPIEATAIGEAFRTYRADDQPLYIGSVKSNIGHLEGCSGLAGVIKMVLALEAGVIPPNANFEALNPKIDAGSLRIKIPEEAVLWPSNGLRRVSVQNFGFGGSNGHVILDDAYHFMQLHELKGNHMTSPVPLLPITANGGDDQVSGQHVEKAMNKDQVEPGNGYHTHKLLVLSAADEEGISRIKRSWQSSSLSALNLTKGALKDLTHTLANRRSHMRYRAFTVPEDEASVVRSITTIAGVVRTRDSPNLGLIFTGQGSQWYAMGRELLGKYEVYKKSLVEAGEYFRSLGCSWTVTEELGAIEPESRVNDAQYSQPLCTALQLALVEMLQSFGLKPTVVVGHSSGEIAAAFCAGAISRESAWKLAYYRGLLAARLFETSSIKGSMIAVGLSRSEVQHYLERAAGGPGTNGLVVACVNSPTNVTISGEEGHIDRLQNLLKADKIFARRLRVGVAYHSFQMKEVADEYRSCIGTLPRPPNARGGSRMASSVTGNWISPYELAKTEYWIRNLVSPVLFSDAVACVCVKPFPMASKGDGPPPCPSDLLEVGPHSALQGPIREILSKISKDKTIAYIPILTRQRSAVVTVLEAMGRLHSLGHPVRLPVVNCEQPGTLRSLTTLPQYPFDHSKSYWHENRISKGYRFRRFGSNDLLGVPDTDFNPLEAKWRNCIRPTLLPWIEDHKINGTILYPAAGMLVMAMEAAKQVADSTKGIESLVLKDVTFESTISIPLSTTSAGVEVNLFMRPLAGQDEKDIGAYEFRIYAYNNDTWQRKCKGLVQIVYDRFEESELGYMKESREWRRKCCRRYEDALSSCLCQGDVERWYNCLNACGYNYGPAFRAVAKIAYDEDSMAVSEVHAYHDPQTMSMSAKQDYIIHPSTFDCILQTVLAVHTEGGNKKTATSIPTRLDRLWAAVGPPAQHSIALQSVKVCTKTERVGMRQSVSSLVVLNQAADDVRIEMTGFYATDVASTGSHFVDIHESQAQPASEASELCHYLDWKPDLEFLTTDRVQRFCQESGSSTHTEPVQFYSDVEFLIYAYIRRTLDSVDGEFEEKLLKRRHTEMYLLWMKNKMELLHTQNPLLSARLGDARYVDELSEQVALKNKQGLLYKTVGQNLYHLLAGEMDTLDLLFRGDAVRAFYEEVYQGPSTMQLLRLLDVMVHKNPTLRFLEIGAGTGGMTRQLMTSLAKYKDGKIHTANYAQFDFTDISSYFFAAAKEEFASHGDRISFMKLNIESDPEAQGFVPESYDVVFAAAVLHATHDLTNTLRNCRKLLKPGGKLILSEITRADTLKIGFVFGLLEGWWLSSEPDRKWSPCLDVEGWGQLLSKTGFSPQQIVLPDYHNEICQEISVIVATAVTEAESVAETSGEDGGASKKAIIFIYGDNRQLAIDLQSHMADCSRNHFILVYSLEEVLEHLNQIKGVLVFLHELSQPVWCNMSKTMLAALQQVLPQSDCNVLWISRNDSSDPRFRLIDGVSRVINSELGRTAITSLVLDISGEGQVLLRREHVNHVAQLCESLAMSSSEATYTESEYLERAGILHIPRFADAGKLNKVITEIQQPIQQVHRPWLDGDGGTPLRLTIESPGLLDTLRFVEDTEHNVSDLGANDIEIMVVAVGLNFRDVLVALGRIDHQRLGSEVVGVVTRMGAACTNGSAGCRLQIGDRVAGFYLDTFKSFLSCDWRSMVKIPDTIPTPVAASIPVNFFTAWVALRDRARLQPGETVLIHSAAGGTGQAAIQVAQSLGAKIIATVGSESKRDFLMERYGIQSDLILSSRDTSFAMGVKRLTEDRGVDVVLNSLSGDGLVASWECIAPYGRFIELGKKDILSRNTLPMHPFYRNVTFSTFDASSLVIDRPDLVQSVMSEVFQLVADGEFHPSEPVQTHGVGQVEKAFRKLQSGKTTGKIVVEFRPDDMVEAMVTNRPRFLFRPDASYVISGGLGGLGRTVARWFADRGARNLILLSRSGSESTQASNLIQELSDKGVTVATPVCDISDAMVVSSVIAECLQSMPPIRGCIQSAMLLRDAAFESTSFEAWEQSLAPKVAGSWNLHEQLPRDLDFFIMMSSMAGVWGNPGQANYAAGNTFMDALAKHRIQLGERAASLDLGPVASAGALTADSSKLAEKYSALVQSPLNKGEIIALLDYYCDPSTLMDPERCQILLFRPRTDEGRESNYFAKKTMFRQMTADGNASISNTRYAAASSGQKLDLVRALSIASSLSQAADAVCQALAQKLASSLSISHDDIDMDSPLHVYGMDSLVAVELRNWLAREIKVYMPIFNILVPSMTVRKIAESAVGSTALKKGWVSIEASPRKEISEVAEI